MRWSLIMAILLLALKSCAYAATRSTSILSDTMESILHLLAVCFAAYSVHLANKPADKDHPYGHAKIAFFSAGIEGAAIFAAALFILWESLRQLAHGSSPEALPLGILLTTVVLVSNLILGNHLIRQSHKIHCIILRANGLHVMTDAWSSAGVIVALALVWVTGWAAWDPLIALFIAAHILYKGCQLMSSGFNGLMDKADAATIESVSSTLKNACTERKIEYHNLRLRDTGGALDVDVDLLFPDEMSIREAHALATEVENAIDQSLPGDAHIRTHLEPRKHHRIIHPSGTAGSLDTDPPCPAKN
jgi:cation diffusion facilitator family transporter